MQAANSPSWRGGPQGGGGFHCILQIPLCLGRDKVFTLFKIHRTLRIILRIVGKYILSNLKSGKPVLVGVDERSGTNINEGTTDHFVVIVGTGQDQKGNFLVFFDNGSTTAEKGASSANRIYYNEKNNTLIGGSSVYPGEGSNFYKLSQIRKNIPD